MHGCRYALNGTEDTLDGSQCLDFMYGQALGWSYVNTPGKAAWQAALTTGFRVPACSRTNTDSVLYLFLACTRPPDFDTDRGAKTRIAWQLQSNEDIVH